MIYFVYAHYVFVFDFSNTQNFQSIYTIKTQIYSIMPRKKYCLLVPRSSIFFRESKKKKESAAEDEAEENKKITQATIYSRTLPKLFWGRNQLNRDVQIVFFFLFYFEEIRC